ncbi:MAG: PilZ domain-containing protein [Candidatus Omnitrophica bacterium]|nr:PilZ domain-containing protein [Candidatus Omnitrophota bacterium]
MQETDFTERRSSPRFHARVAVLCVNPANSRVYLSKSYDLSTYGIRLILTEPIKPLTDLSMCLHMADNGEQINVRGEVVWSRKADDDHFMVGVRLKDCALRPVSIALRSIQACL